MPSRPRRIARLTPIPSGPTSLARRIVPTREVFPGGSKKGVDPPEDVFPANRSTEVPHAVTPLVLGHGERRDDRIGHALDVVRIDYLELSHAIGDGRRGGLS